MRRDGLLAVGIAALAAVGFVVGLGDRTSTSFASFTTPVMAATVAVGWTFLLAGVLAGRRRGGEVTGRLLLVAGALWFAQFLILSPAGWLFVLGVALGERHLVPVAHLILALPDGRLVRTARWLAGTVYVTAIALSLSTPFVLERVCPQLPCPSPRPTFASPSWFQDLVLVVDQYGTAALAMMVGGFVIIRLVRSDGAARRAIAPVLLAGAVLVPVYASGQLQLLPQPAGTWLYLAVNAAVPLAVLGGMAWARLHRASVADLVLAIDRGASGDDLREALAHSLGDPSLRLLFPSDGPDEGYLDADGRQTQAAHGARRTRTPVGQDGRVIAILEHDRALLDEPELLDAAVAASRLALHNARLTAQVRAQLDELRSSRARLVVAVDQERRRLERDLHDGVQQQLLAVALELGRLRRLAGGAGYDELGRTLERTREDLEHAIDELRRFARGIHPQILSDRGVPAALDALAQRVPIPVRIDASLDRLAPEMESTLYLVAAEAITNTIRHGDATHVRIAVCERDGRVRLDIRDDGEGGARADGSGSGLQGLSDRVAALGGTVTVASPHGQGTRLQIDLPVDAS